MMIRTRSISCAPICRPKLPPVSVRKAGADHVMLGTDYPFDMGHYDPLSQIEGVTSLSDEARVAIRGGTAARLLKLDS